MKRLDMRRKTGPRQCSDLFLRNIRSDLATPRLTKHYATERTRSLFFLLHCRKPKAEPFMEWIVEIVLPREVRKFFSAIEEKDNQIQANQQKILRFNEEIDDLIKKQARNRRGYFDNVLCFIKKNGKEAHPCCVIQFQYRQLEKKQEMFKLCYPNMKEAGRCDDPNAIH